MKKFSLIILLLLGMVGMTRAQYTLSVNGDVNDAGAPVPFHPVTLLLYSGGTVAYADSALTDSAGLFSFSVAVNGFFSQGLAVVSTPDCQFGFIADTAAYSPANTALNFSLSICAGSASCVSQFSAQNQGQGLFSFTNQSTGGTPMSPLVYVWDFGDGSTSTATNPSHTYNSAGTYLVCLTVIDSLGGCVNTSCQPVVNGSGGANCSVFFVYSQAGTNAVGFTTVASGTPGFSFNWTFGDNTTGTGPTPVHTYASSGSYVACVTLTDSAGCTSTFCDSVIVGSGGGSGNCYAAFNAFNNGGTSVGFFNLSAGGSPAAPLTYSWSFGDGNSSTAMNPVHTYSNAGTYTACLFITDNQGCVDSTCQVITVTTGGGGGNCSPFFFSIPTGPTSYQFVSDSSNGPGTSYSWSFGDGTGSSSPNPQHTYASSGVYIVCLTVADSSIGCTATFCDSVYVGNAPGCFADFSYGLTALGDVQFVNFSFGSAPLSYLWDFGDGNTSTQQDPSHTYANPGTYNVCLTIFDNAGCGDSVCYPVFVGSAPNPCDASWFGINTGNQIYALCAYTFDPNYSYSWDFGDGSSGAGHSVIHTYANTGLYLVCLTVTDSASGCSDTFCDSLVVSSMPNLCSAGFTWLPSGSGAVSFLDLSVGGSAISPLSYFWDFGDSTTSTQQNPIHTFASSGPYNVCLTITDSLTGCTSTICQLVTIGSGNYNISGLVFADSNNLIYNGIVYLIQHDSVAGTLTAIDSTFIGQSYYNFSNVTPGTYLIKAALLPASPDYANYLPTYLGDDVFWYNATSTIVTNSNILNPPIMMVQGTNPGGPGFVGGLISQGANKGPGDPLKDVSVLLMHTDGTGATHTTTDATGHFSFDNLAYGTYEVYVEILGKTSDPWIVTIDGNNPEFEVADFEVGNNHVNAVGTTAIDEFTFGEVMGIYPNPASNVLNVGVEFTEPADLTLSLVNMMGQTVRNIPSGLVAGQREISIDLSNLPEGTYLLRLQANDQVISRRIIKQ